LKGSSIWHKFVIPVLTHFRRKRGIIIRELLPSMINGHVLDLGGSVHFWQCSGLLSLPRQITILNISTDEIDIFEEVLPVNNINLLLYDGVRIPFEDNYFDSLICNSVLEHVPSDSRSILSLEMQRVSKHGFVQTPAFEFFFEPHFVAPIIHWLPDKLGRFLVDFTPWALLSRPSPERKKKYWEEVQLLKKREFQYLFQHARLYEERFGGMVKSYYIVW
jgi:ubiquinone/menaquinone biosynthesis C-methylase UbiE